MIGNQKCTSSIAQIENIMHGFWFSKKKLFKLLNYFKKIQLAEAKLIETLVFEFAAVIGKNNFNKFSD